MTFEMQNPQPATVGGLGRCSYLREYVDFGEPPENDLLDPVSATKAEVLTVVPRASYVVDLSHRLSPMFKDTGDA